MGMDEAPNGHAASAADAYAANASFVDPGLGNLPPLYGHCVDDARRMKLICIGAGFSGVLAGIRFPQRVPNLDFTIYEKNPEVGGTWYENKYVAHLPGVYPLVYADLNHALQLSRSSL